MKIFISYSVKIKNLAGEIKKELEIENFSCFLAHEDIQPTEIWMDTIHKNLKESDIFLALLTSSFSKSYWCNQEIGIAYSLNKLIIPVKIDNDPLGFISKYQALKYNRGIKFPISKMISVVAKNENYRQLICDFLVGQLSNSSSFNEANKNAERISILDGFTEKQLRKISKSLEDNDQIYRSFKAYRILSQFLSAHKEKVK